MIRGPLNLSVVCLNVPLLMLSFMNLSLKWVKVSAVQMIFVLPLSAGMVMICLFCLKKLLCHFMFIL